jgi:hypothetical protein
MNEWARKLVFNGSWKKRHPGGSRLQVIAVARGRISDRPRRVIRIAEIQLDAASQASLFGSWV